MSRLQTSFRIDEPLHKRFQHTLIDRGESMNAVLERLIEDYVSSGAPAKAAASAGEARSQEPGFRAADRRLLEKIDAEISRLQTSGTPNGALSDFLEQAPFEIAVMDRSGRYLLVNAAFARLAGRPRSEILFRTCGEVWGAEYGEALLKCTLRAAESPRWTCTRDELPFEGEVRSRMTLRFGIQDQAGEVASVGQAGLDWLDLPEDEPSPAQDNTHGNLWTAFVRALPVPFSISDTARGRVLYRRAPVGGTAGFGKGQEFQFHSAGRPLTATLSLHVALRERLKAWAELPANERPGWVPLEISAWEEEIDPHADLSVLFSGVITDSPAGLAVHDQTGAIVCANDSYLIQVSRDSLAGVRPADFLSRRQARETALLERKARAGKVLGCVEELPGPARHLSLRFPIPGEHNQTFSGVVSFNLENLVYGLSAEDQAELRRQRVR